MGSSEETVISLFTFPPTFGLRNVSPFCLRVEMALTHLDIPFEIVLESNPAKGPKNKLPFIISNNEIIDDSELIYLHLDQLTDGQLFEGLSPTDYGIGCAFTRLVDDHLYWLIVASRWLDDDWFPNVYKGFFGAFPPVVRDLISALARRQMRKTLDLQGLGRHSLNQQKAFARRDLQALANVLTDSRYIVGNKLSVFDFSITSMLSGLLDNVPGTWVTAIGQEFPELQHYADRIQAEVGVYGRTKP
ncbi:MAG: glutathione S-transferase family protein [Luminiphilus sp.]|nr:glutathione S-transferase family protein [Luminiphilus sp.]